MKLRVVFWTEASSCIVEFAESLIVMEDCGKRPVLKFSEGGLICVSISEETKGVRLGSDDVTNGARVVLPNPLSDVVLPVVLVESVLILIG